MIQVDVIVFATLRRYLPELKIGQEKVLTVPEGTTLDDIQEELGLPAEEVKVIMRNNRQADPSEAAEDGDRIAYIPAVAGG